MKKMHICLYALFQIVQSESPTSTTGLPPDTTELPPVTTGPPPVTTALFTATENTDSCTRDEWGYCDCNDDEYRNGF